jgi:ABC-2 type transport system permease protein
VLIFGRALADRRRSLAWWTVGVAIYCGFILAVWPVIKDNDDFDELFEELPDTITAMYGGDSFADFSSPVGFLSTYLYSMILPFIFAALAISLGGSLIAGEDEDGVLDLVLSYPVSRRRVVGEKTAALFAMVAVLAAATVVLLIVGREPVDLDIGAAGLFVATLGSALFAIAHGSISMFVGAVTGKKGRATAVGWGVALAGYLANVVANIDDSLGWLEKLSPLHWATSGSTLAGDLPPSFLALVAMVAVFFAATLIGFERHDLK